MACIPEVPKDECIDALARNFPEGDALPDGFSECLTQAPGDDTDISKEPPLFQEDEVLSEERDCLLEMKAEQVSKRESIQALARKLPEGDALPDGFSECFTEDVSAIEFSKEQFTLQTGEDLSDESGAVLEIKPGDESIQAVARKLPEGDALPDGFSECLTEASGNKVSAIDPPKESSAPQEGEALPDKGDGVSEIKLESSRCLGTFPAELTEIYGVTSSLASSQKFPPDSSDISVDVEDGSSCSSPSDRKKDRREKFRRFPVQLSDKDSLDHMNEKLAESKGDQKSEGHADNSEKTCVGTDFDTWSNSSTNMSAKLCTDTTSLSTKSGPDLQVSLNIDSKQCVDNRGDKAAKGTTRVGKQGEAETNNAVLVEGRPCSSDIVQLIEQDAVPKDKDGEIDGSIHVTALEDELLSLRYQNELLSTEKKITSVELAKSLLIREKLESLCRELQRQNKQLKDDCRQIASEEQQKRLDLSTRFHDAIKDVTVKLEEQGDERLRHIKENEMLQEKLRHFAQQYEFREQQNAQQLRTKSLEQQLLEVKLKQQEELSKQGEAKIQLYMEQIAQLLKTEQDLRGRLTLYGDKFVQFQDTLTQSNEVFASFKMEMEKMSKTIKKLEKENLSLKKKCEKSDVSLIELVDERASLKKQLETAKNQKEKLEALCRSLQAERKQHSLAMANVAASTAAKGAVSVAAALKSEQVADERNGD